MGEDFLKGKARIFRQEDKNVVSIPSKKNVFVLLFNTAWLVAWLFGEIAVITQLTYGIHPFLLFWLAGWTYGGAHSMLRLSWMSFGKELIFLDMNNLTIVKKVFIVFSKKEYVINHIKNVRVVDNDGSFFSGKQSGYYGINGGKIYFDYGMKTVKFGINLDAAEANYLIEIIFSDSKK